MEGTQLMHSRKFKTVLVATALGSALMLTSCSGTNAATGADTGEVYTGTIDLSLPLGEGSHQHIGAQAFGDKLTELTDGRIEVQYFFNNTLGGEREVVEGMSIDSIDMGVSSTGPMGGFVPEFFVFDLPYLFDSVEHAYAVLDSDIGEDLTTKFEEAANVKVLAWTENGYRNETNSVRPIESPADLVGIKHRTQESEVQVDTWRALGANATPMAWPEVYTALQQGVMDSQENPIATIMDVKFYEVQDYLTFTKHVYSPAPIMMSNVLFESFSPEDQAAVLEASAYALPLQREASQLQEVEMTQALVDEGMQVTEPDLAPFRAAVEPVYEKWAPQIGEDLIDSIRNFDY